VVDQIGEIVALKAEENMLQSVDGDVFRLRRYARDSGMYGGKVCGIAESASEYGILESAFGPGFIHSAYAPFLVIYLLLL